MNVVLISHQGHGCDRQLAAVRPTVITWTGISIQVIHVERLHVYKERRRGNSQVTTLRRRPDEGLGIRSNPSGYGWQRHTFRAWA